MEVVVKGQVAQFPTQINRFLEDAAELMYQSVTRNFEAGGRPAPWMAKRDGSPSHLIKTGRLFSSIQKEVDYEGTFARVYTPRGGVPYAFAHQFGGVPNVPIARPYMLWQDEDRTRLVEMFGGWLISFMQTHKKDINAKA